MSRATFILLLVASGCGRYGDVIATGRAGGACYGNGTCDPGLVCASNDLCVDDETLLCADVSCSGHGSCVVSDGSPSCVCDAGFEPVGPSCVAASGCDPVPHAYSLCDEGDVYWFDGCGMRGQLRQGCGGAGCTGSQCAGDTAGMVLIDDFPGGSFYIDVYESAVSALGNWGDQDQDRDNDGKLADPAVVAAHAATHGWVWDDDGGEEDTDFTTKLAVSGASILPAADVSFYQSAAACTNAGKRLCTTAEWLWACQNGTALTEYPYGNAYDDADDPFADCWTNHLSASEQVTGSATGCVTANGIYDMSGNMGEYTELKDPWGIDVRGGGHDRAADQAHCSYGYDESPSYRISWAGIRCCRSP